MELGGRMNNKIINHDNHTSMKLTPREVECLYWASRGKTIEETAMILNIKSKTVISYLNGAKLKLNAIKMTQAVYIATKQGILQ